MTNHAELVVDIRETLRHFEQRMDMRFDSLDQKMSKQFLWLAGIVLAGMVTVVSAVIARI